MGNSSTEAIAQYAMKAVQTAEQLDLHIEIEISAEQLYPLSEWFHAPIVDDDLRGRPVIKLKRVTLILEKRRSHVGYLHR